MMNEAAGYVDEVDIALTIAGLGLADLQIKIGKG
jgi:hypothetical protein